MTRMMTPAEHAQWQALVDAAPDDEVGTCPDCGKPFDEVGTTWCSRQGEQICPDCHYESDCGCRG